MLANKGEYAHAYKCGYAHEGMFAYKGGLANEDGFNRIYTLFNTRSYSYKIPKQSHF